MRLIKLHQAPHPEAPTPAGTCLIDPTRILVVSRGSWIPPARAMTEARRQSIEALHDEVNRVIAEANTMPQVLAVENKEDEIKAKRCIAYREAAQELTTAANLVYRVTNQVASHKEIDCTVVQLACGTGLEHGVMLANVFVVETPEEIALMLEQL